MKIRGITIEARDIARFWPKLETGIGCWIWKANTDMHGYGHFRIRKLTVPAHRFMYVVTRGVPIPEGLEVDHLCRVRNCVRPDHLEVVTQYENGMRGMSPAARNARKLVCKAGHRFTKENTFYRKSGGRSCRQCMRQNYSRDRLKAVQR